MTTFAYVGNTNLVQLNGLKDGSTGLFVNDATVTVTIEDSLGTPISGETFPVTMSYVTGSNGDYEGAVSENLALVDGTTYYAVIDATFTGAVGHWEYAFTAKTRRAE